MRKHLITIGMLCLFTVPILQGTVHAEPATVQVFDACDAGAEVQRVVEALRKAGLTATAAGRVRQAEESSLLLTPEQTAAGQTVVGHLPMRPRMLRVRENPPGAVRLIVGCDMVRREPAVPVRQAGIIVLNGCRNEALGEAVARKLILSGFNVTRISSTSEETTPGKSEIHTLAIHQATAERLRSTLPGEPSLETWDQLPEGIEIQLVVGCEQTTDW